MCLAHPESVDWVRHLEDTLESFDDIGGHRCLSRVFEELPLDEALTTVVMPYLHGLGERWENGTIGVGQEHFASNVIRTRLSILMQETARSDGPRVVLACMPNEHHEFGLMATSLVLAQLGWRTCYLGANTPITELVRACTRLHPDAVVLSAHRETAYAAHAPVLRRLAADTPIHLGAQGASADLVALCEATHLAAGPVEGARHVNDLLSAPEAAEAG